MDRRIRFYAEEHVNSCKLSLVAKDFRGWQLTSFRCDKNANIIFHLDIEERIVCIEFLGKSANFLRDVTLPEPCYEKTVDGYLLRLHHIMPRVLYKTKGIAVYFADDQFNEPVAVAIFDLHVYSEQMLNGN